METTKTKRHLRMTLPKELVEILKWHVARLPERLKEKTDLMFPSVRGVFHAPSTLDKPFKDVAKEIVLAKKISARAMRRTFQDLARAAEVKDVVTRAILRARDGGHAEALLHRVLADRRKRSNLNLSPASIRRNRNGWDGLLAGTAITALRHGGIRLSRAPVGRERSELALYRGSTPCHPVIASAAGARPKSGGFACSATHRETRRRSARALPRS